MVLRGTMLQLTIAATVCSLGGIILFWIASCVANPVLQMAGGVAALLVFLAGPVLLFCQFLRQAGRPQDGQQTSMTVRTPDRVVEVTNPPDSLLDRRAIGLLIRECVNGIDPNICPDGLMLGPASSGESAPLTEEARTSFRARNQSRIDELLAAADTLQSGDIPNIKPVL